LSYINEAHIETNVKQVLAKFKRGLKLTLEIFLQKYLYNMRNEDSLKKNY